MHRLAKAAGIWASGLQPLQAAGPCAATAITNPSQQVNALARVAEALAAAGQHDQALAAARTITNPSQQAQTLTGIAITLADSGDHASAARVDAAVCATTGWETAIGLARLAPTTCVSLVKILDRSRH
jgi:hypothetical protein